MRYRLGVRLGAGGMAEVFRGTITGAEGFVRDVAIKRVLPGLSDAAQFGAMFVSEARIASQLSHANIVHVIDFDRDADGRLFLAMELVDGKDLDAILEAGPVPPAIAIFAITEVLRGLGHAHDRGVVHRDVSPRNVLVAWDGSVKVSDFGIAKARDATWSTTIRGKPGYMSPEQARGTRVDGRSDLFAVGVMLWELLAGIPLFAGSTHEAIAQVLFRKIPRPSQLCPAAPAELEAIAMRLLERDPAARYPTADAVIDDLSRSSHAPRNGRGDLVRWLAARFLGVIDTKAVTVAVQAVRSPRRSRVVLALVAATAVAVGVGGAVVVELVTQEAPSVPGVRIMPMGSRSATNPVPPRAPHVDSPPDESNPTPSRSPSEPAIRSRPPVASKSPRPSRDSKSARPPPKPAPPAIDSPGPDHPQPPMRPPGDPDPLAPRPSKPFDPDEVGGD